MKKIFCIVMFLLLIIRFSLQAEIVKSISLDPDNILEENQMELTLDDVKMNAVVVKQDDTLYIDSDFFKNNFPDYEEAMKNNPIYGGTFTDKSGKEVLCLPAFLALKALEVRYTFSSLYGTVIIRIRTDKEFKVNPDYSYESTDSAGNTPVQPNDNDFTGGYSVITYSQAVPPGYGYYYPPGYQPGFYFGDYGFVEQGPQLPSIYTNVPLPQGPMEMFTF